MLSLAVLLFGDEYNGSKRWLSMGPLSFQPSEFAKVAVILLLTCVINKGKGEETGDAAYMAGTMALLLPIVGLVGTNNLSTAIIILGIGVILDFCVQSQVSALCGNWSSGSLFIGIFLSMASYRLERLAIWQKSGSL